MSEPVSDPVMPSEPQMWDALTYVYDPELEIDVVNLGLVYEVTVDGPCVELLMTLTTMGCPVQEDIEQMARVAVLSVPGVEQVTVRWTFNPPWTPDRVTQEGRDMLSALGFL